ncbi:MAG TPA: hypothetical protein VM099_13510 [Gemmatimonadaceae bacterium]|nr:hypothetical protein [Gemmatimonadaceae bacterium]
MLTRREFTSSMAGIIFSRRFLDPIARYAATGFSLRAGLLLPALSGGESQQANDIAAGAALALAESKRAAELFGHRIEMVEIASGKGDDHRINIFISGFADSDSARRESSRADRAGIPFLNVAATGNGLRRDQCPGNLYHIAASDAMIASAKQTLSPSQSGASIELWDKSLEKYGASQLNDRFQNRAGRPMTSHAWAGWFALKVAWETALRAQSSAPSALLGVLDKNGMQYDGHKGAPLSFRSWDHQLRQPLYAVERETVVAELPDIARNSEVPANDQLDKFGDAARVVNCERVAR